jgi:UPF0755 protein
VSSKTPDRTTTRPKGLPLSRRLLIMAGSAFATLSLLALLAGFAVLWLYTGPGPASAGGRPTTVILRQGAGVSEIASTLERSGVIRSASVFIAATQISGAGHRLKAGEYEFASRDSMAAVMDKIRKGLIVHHLITIPEGLTSEEAVDVLMNSDVLAGAAPVPAEGALLPETYEVRRGEDRGEVLQRMIDARDTLLRTLWAQRRPDLPLRSPEEAMTLASVVEKETGLAAERPKVAAVFVNRLKKGIRLQSDPTIIYGLTRGRPLGRGIRASELAGYTPYNTYLIDGLPPTPICNPGRAAIAAVLDPAPTDDLYFVADGSGGHAFASTLEQHQKNVDHWRALEKQRAKPAGTAG